MLKISWMQGTAAFLALAAISTIATPVTITTPFMNLENDGINSIGFSSGQFIQIGANSLVPNGNVGTTGLGSTSDLTTGRTVTPPDTP